jgi:hypothetical protein
MKKRIALLARIKKNGKYPYITVKIIRGRVSAPIGSTSFYLRYTQNGERKTEPIPGRATRFESGKFVIDSDYIILRYKEAHKKLGLPLPRFFEPLKPTFIYFIRATLSKRIKIGVAQDVQKRLGDLQVANSEPLELAACISVERSGLTESAVHSMFKCCRIRGEWFESTPELEKFITEKRGHIET